LHEVVAVADAQRHPRGLASETRDRRHEVGVVLGGGGRRTERFLERRELRRVTGEEFAESERRAEYEDEAGRGILVAQHRGEFCGCRLAKPEQQLERLVGVGRVRERREELGRIQHGQPRTRAAELGETQPREFGQRGLVA
jgi:hypothetical protein